MCLQKNIINVLMMHCTQKNVLDLLNLIYVLIPKTIVTYSYYPVKRNVESDRKYWFLECRWILTSIELYLKL